MAKSNGKGNPFSQNYPTEEIREEWAERHWKGRHLIFSKFDEGIQLPDMNGWFNVTTEETAIRQAQRYKGLRRVVEGFGGCGGNSIQLAQVVDKVIHVELNPARLEAAKNNARIYGVDHKIEFIQGNFIEIAGSLEADAVFFSPPWSATFEEYTAGYKTFDLTTMKPYDGKTLFEAARKISDNIGFFVAPQVQFNQLKDLAKPGEEIEIQNETYPFVPWCVYGTTAYYGSLVNNPPRPAHLLQDSFCVTS